MIFGYNNNITIKDFKFLINNYVFEEDEKMNKEAVDLKYDLLLFLRRNPIILDYLMIEKTISPEEALMLNIDNID